MQRAAIFAAPALYEPFGLGVLEAARSGCALLLSDIASFRELWDGCAEFVDPRDPAAIAAAIRRLLEDPARRAELISLGEQRFPRFTWERAARSTLETYQRALRARSRNSTHRQ
jgi:glycosyltransferase involved in cell wall biosynthesis